MQEPVQSVQNCSFLDILVKEEYEFSRHNNWYVIYVNFFTCS